MSYNGRYICDKLGIKTEIFIPEMYSNIADSCTTLALSNLLDKNFMNVYQMQIEMAEKLNCYVVSKSHVINQILINNGYLLYGVSLPLAQFIDNYKQGKYCVYIINPDDIMNNHVLSYIDGIWYDSEENLEFADEYLCWSVNIIAAEKSSIQYLDSSITNHCLNQYYKKD